MKKLLDKIRLGLSTRSFRAGGYSVAAIVLVTAIAVVVNIIAGGLPASMMQKDITSNGLFSLSEETVNLVSNVSTDITVYWIVQQGQEDTTVETLLNRYASLSSHISIVQKDPDVFPTFLNAYETSNVTNNCLIVESDSRYRYISYYDIYEYDYSSYYTTGSYSVNFAGEGALTSAIDYVTDSELPVMYTLTGHGEASLSDSMSSGITNSNILVQDLSLISAGSVPEDAGCVLINAPQKDISAEEADMLLTYMSSGGNVIMITDPLETEASRDNLDSIAAAYGMQEIEGIVLEADSSCCAFGTPYYLLPVIQSHTVTAPLLNGNYYVMIPLAHGIKVMDSLEDGLTVTTLLETSSSSYSKIAGYDMNTYDYENGDIIGPFAVAALAEEGDSHLIWIGGASFCDDNVNNQVSGGNMDLFLNCLSYVFGETDSISIHAKSLSAEYLTMSSSTSRLLTALVVVIVPAAYLAVGIAVRSRRKRK